MRIDSDELTFLVGSMDILNKMKWTPALPTFSQRAVDFLAALSKVLLDDKQVRTEPDIMSFAYWIRRASLLKAKSNHPDSEYRLGRGVAFHVAPSNVPVNFAVSMTSSVLAGNMSIVRVSNKPFKAVDIICQKMNDLLAGEYQSMAPYFCIVRYDHNENITQMLSEFCDVRIVWGGNRTIQEIRKAMLSPRAIEMCFADRHSVAIIDSDYYLECDEKEIAKKFYTDTFYTDQNACSSPRLVVWTGNNVEQAKERFWSALEKMVIADYPMQPIQAVDKYTSFCKLAMSGEKIAFETNQNYVVRVSVDRLTADLMDYKEGSGYFFEYESQNLNDLVPVLGKQCQTVSVLGVEKEYIKKMVFEHGVRGVDRIVSLGETMGLEFIWDGYKMIESMSRIVYVGSKN